MADRIRSMEVDSRYTSSQRVEYLRRQGAPSAATSPLDHVHYQIELARQLLRAGSTRAAVARLDTVHRQVENQRLPAYEKEARRLQSLRALSYLRLGEQRNCLVDHGAASCIFPIRGEGVHEFKRGSRKAVELYGEILGDRPGDLRARWLYNLAHMTLGTYPDEVTERWRFPPGDFEDTTGFPL